MTTQFKTALAAGIAAITLAGAAPLLMAQDAPQQGQQHQQRGRGPGGPGGPGFGGPMRGPGGPGFDFRGLDLTDDQRAQLRKIRESHQDEFRAVGEKMRAAREGMRALLEADSINESAIRAKSAEVAAAEADAAILNAKVRAESMQILTAEQQAKLKELRTSRQGHMRQRRGQL